MKLLNVIFLFGLCFSIALSAPSLSSSDSLNTSLHQAVSGSGDKKCRINVCFAIDGSGSINESEFRSAKKFLLDVGSVFMALKVPQLTLGAVQFATDSKLISPQTQDISAFRFAVENALPIGGISSVGLGIASCDFQLATTEGEASRIILISDGRNNFGADPVEVANNYRARDPNGKVESVVIGDAPGINVLNGITANGVLFEVDQILDIPILIDSFVKELCELQ